jgi:GDPmannose 4,6-dehydratase
MCAEMVAEDLRSAQRMALLRSHGHDVAISREAGGR